jgi:hypothetical protein
MNYYRVVWGRNKRGNPTRNELTDLSQTLLDLKSDFFTIQG